MTEIQMFSAFRRSPLLVFTVAFIWHWSSAMAIETTAKSAIIVEVSTGKVLLDAEFSHHLLDVEALVDLLRVEDFVVEEFTVNGWDANPTSHQGVVPWCISIFPLDAQDHAGSRRAPETVSKCAMRGARRRPIHLQDDVTFDETSIFSGRIAHDTYDEVTPVNVGDFEPHASVFTFGGVVDILEFFGRKELRVFIQGLDHASDGPVDELFGAMVVYRIIEDVAHYL